MKIDILKLIKLNQSLLYSTLENTLAKAEKIELVGLDRYEPVHHLIALPTDETSSLVETVTQRAGVTPMNHACYRVEMNDGEKFTILFSDGMAIVGLGTTKTIS